MVRGTVRLCPNSSVSLQSSFLVILGGHEASQKYVCSWLYQVVRTVAKLAVEAERTCLHTYSMTGSTLIHVHVEPSTCSPSQNKSQDSDQCQYLYINGVCMSMDTNGICICTLMDFMEMLSGEILTNSQSVICFLSNALTVSGTARQKSFTLGSQSSMKSSAQWPEIMACIQCTVAPC